MISQILALALSAQPCPNNGTLEASNFEAKMEQSADGQADILAIEGANVHCQTIEITRPDGARYILQAEDVEGSNDGVSSLALPLRADGQIDAENLVGLPGFFNTAGQYVLNIWPANQGGGYQKPLYRKELSWQFPECSLTTYFIEDWMFYLRRFDGEAVKTKLGYEKQIEGPGFASFDISMSSCTAMGLFIEIKGLKAGAKDRILNEAIGILRQVDEGFVDQHEVAIRQLGEGMDEFEATNEYDVTTIHGAAVSDGDSYDIKLSVSLHL